MAYPRIGLEIHAQLLVSHKLFSPAEIGTIHPFDIAVPGYLPILNQHCVDKAIAAAHILNCKINPQIQFDRKHYSYPDLPHGYQMTQYYSIQDSNN